jgi:hypothetical protein
MDDEAWVMNQRSCERMDVLKGRAGVEGFERRCVRVRVEHALAGE